MSGGKSFGHVSLHIGSDWTVRCSTYPWTTPILTIDAGSTAVSVSIEGRDVIPATAVAFARDLADKAAKFAADCERLHAIQQGQAVSGGEAPEAAA